MRERLRSLEQLMPFATAGELIEQKARPLVSVSADTTAHDALRAMHEHDIGFLPVLDGTRLAGVVSERDIARGVILERRAVVREIMTSQVYSVAPETRVGECLSLMYREHVRHVPVLRGCTLHGVLSVRDLMGSLIERHERLLRKLQQERVTVFFPNSNSY